MAQFGILQLEGAAVGHARSSRNIRVNRQLDTSKMAPPGPDADSVPAITPSSLGAGDSLRDVVAYRLRAAYMRERRRYIYATTGRTSTYGDKPIPLWDGGRDTSGVVRKSVWLDIADLLMHQNKLAPERFVQAQFRGSKSPHPSQLKSSRAWELFDAFDSDSATRLKYAFASYANVFKGACAEIHIWYPAFTDRQVRRHVLRDYNRQLSALFRYCAGIAEDIGDVAKEFFPLALEEYLQDPAGYDRVWGTQIPQFLRSEARSLLVGPERNSHG